MKRVRYVVGAAGLAPMVLGAAAGGGAHAAPADATSHGKAVTPSPQTRQVRIPDINRVGCSPFNDWLVVFQSSFRNNDCFANAGFASVKIYHITDVYTGNNGVSFGLSYNGISHGCYDPYKNTNKYATSCGVPNNQATMTYLRIFPGR